MRCDAFHLVPGIPGLLAHLGDCIEDFSVRPTAPVAVGFRSGFFVGGEFAEGLFHRSASTHYTGSVSPFGRCPHLGIEIWGTRLLYPRIRLPSGEFSPAQSSA